MIVPGSAQVALANSLLLASAVDYDASDYDASDWAARKRQLADHWPWPRVFRD